MILFWIWMGLVGSAVLTTGILLWKMNVPISSSARRRLAIQQARANQTRANQIKRERDQWSPPPPAPPVQRTTPHKATPVNTPKKNDGVTRVQCECGKRIALTKTGKFYAHTAPDGLTCKESGINYVRYVIHEDPI